MNSRKLTMNIGMISFMTVFVIMCLLIFSLLSLSSANANVQTTQKSVDHSTLYYQLSSDGQRSLEIIDETLEDLYHQTSSSQEYYDQSAILLEKIENSELHDHILSFELTKETMKLYIEVEILYPGQHYYQIKTWKSSPAKQWEPDQGIDVL